MKLASIILCLVVVIASPRQVVVADCDAVPIEKWGGSPVNRLTDISKPVRLVVIQHTVTPECSKDAECEKLLNGIRKYQTKQFHFDDIGQSFVVGGNGKIYTGAGWKVGSHTLGYNDKSISISFLGDFRAKLPSAEALKAAQDFLACSVSSKDLDENYSLVGHLQLSKTLSPGAMLQDLIKTWPHWRSELTDI